MLKTTTVIGLAAAATLALGGAAYATDDTTPTPAPLTTVTVSPKTVTPPHKSICHGTKSFVGWMHRNDTGHGTPAEWAELSFLRKVVVTATGPAREGKGCNYVVKVYDNGSLKTIKGAGYPNGTPGQIECAKLGRFSGWYVLKATGFLKPYGHLNTTLRTTAQVEALFHGTVTGGAYAWDYYSDGEHWKDASWNGDGVGAGAGNVTGGKCETPTPTPSDSTPEVTPTPTTPGTPDEAPPAAPVPGQPNFTG